MKMVYTYFIICTKVAKSLCHENVIVAIIIYIENFNILFVLKSQLNDGFCNKISHILDLQDAEISKGILK